MIPALLTAVVWAQPAPQYVATRFEMGTRLKRLDAAWLKNRRPELRQAAVPHVQQAVQAFFGGQYGRACMALDSATAALEDRPRFASDAVDLSVRPRVIDSVSPVTISLVWAYEPKGAPTESWESLPLKAGVPYERKFEAESRRGAKFEVVTRFSLGGTRSTGGSVVPGFEARLTQLQTSPLKQLLEEFVQGKSEASVDAGLTLGLAEMGQRGEKPKLPVEIPLAIFDGVRIRAMIPNRPKAVVIALHGAGGSENMFFEAYGAGLGVREAERRGWAFISPASKANSVKASLAWLKSEFNIEGLPVFVMGHSMGGGIAIQTDPDLVKAIALFGPAGNTIPEEMLRKPIFLGYGEKEMSILMSGIGRMSEQLKGSASHEVRAYPRCEHLMIVADALPDAFEFFERAMKR